MTVTSSAVGELRRCSRCSPWLSAAVGGAPPGKLASRQRGTAPSLGGWTGMRGSRKCGRNKMELFKNLIKKQLTEYCSHCKGWLVLPEVDLRGFQGCCYL